MSGARQPQAANCIPSGGSAVAEAILAAANVGVVQ